MQGTALLLQGTYNYNFNFNAVRLKKSLFVAAGSKEYLKIYDGLCILRCVRKKMLIDFFTLGMAHYIEYGQPITPLVPHIYINIMLWLIHLH